MSNALLVIYVMITWNVHNNPKMARWHEFFIPHHVECLGVSYCDEDPPQFFHARNVCERYRKRLVKNWIARSDVPFKPENVVSSRCGVWPDTDEGQKL